MNALGPILLLAGMLALLYGGAALSRVHVASRSRMRHPSRSYAYATLGVGAALTLAGVALLVS